MKPDLETRIADAFGAQLSSKQIADLLAEVAQADADAKAASERAGEVAMDPATRPEAVTQARKEMEDADFHRMRMERASTKLAELRMAAVEREREAEAEKQWQVAIAERDQLVADLREYEVLSKKIVNLLTRLRASDARVSRQNSAEVVARGGGFDPWFPDLFLGVRLPAFYRGDGRQGYLWPQQ